MTTQPTSELRPERRVDDAAVQGRMDDLIRECGADLESIDGRLIRDLILTSLKLITDGRDLGELKLMTKAFKEMRYAYSVFAQYPDLPKISIFGSARTPSDHPDYRAAVEFSRLMADNGWGVITGAGDGIMKAGHEGPGRESSFGLAIRLPFETTANTVIHGDEKLIHFRYFFTRKLMFVSQCDAVAIFPGGFGTQDEAFEALTLVQTGKGAIVPVVLIEGEGGTYWRHWENYVRRSLLDNGFISAEDLNLFHCASTPADALEHIRAFYHNYHSSRYVNDDLVIRIRRRLMPGDIERLNDEFAPVIREGRITQRGPYEVEDEYLDLPRIAFTHTRSRMGLIRRMVDRINEFTPADEAELDPSEVY